MPHPVPVFFVLLAIFIVVLRPILGLVVGTLRRTAEFRQEESVSDKHIRNVCGVVAGVLGVVLGVVLRAYQLSAWPGGPEPGFISFPLILAMIGVLLGVAWARTFMDRRELS